MRLPAPRGHTSAALIAVLLSEPHRSPTLVVSFGTRPVFADDDLQLALWICYELHYRGFDDVHPSWEDHPALLRFRSALEDRWEHGLRTLEESTPVSVVPHSASEIAEWDRHQSFWRPRCDLRVLRDLHGDAYGVPDERTHSVLFTLTLRSPSTSADEAPAVTLALANALSLFGLHRRLVGALAGFLTAVDTMAGDPYAQLAVSSFPAEEVRFGFGVCHELHTRLGRHVLDAWSAGRTSLRTRWLPVSGRVNVGC